MRTEPKTLINNGIVVSHDKTQANQTGNDASIGKQTSAQLTPVLVARILDQKSEKKGKLQWLKSDYDEVDLCLPLLPVRYSCGDHSSGWNDGFMKWHVL